MRICCSRPSCANITKPRNWELGSEQCRAAEYITFTSSTAQGGGGSFKNRKPIGELGCCESGMAERSHWWIERCLRSPLCLSLSLTIYLPIYLLCAFWLGNVLRATTACAFSTSEPPKVFRAWCVLCILTWKCASRHNDVRFFNISTSKSGPELRCFVRFDFEMCFAPQRRALFRHRNFQKWSEHGVFCTFWLGNVLRATTACTFSTSQLPKVVREWCVLYILTSKCASRHNDVHFFDIATSKSGPELRCFVHFDLEMCFAPQRRALFRHRNFQKWSGPEVFCTFWLGNVLRATTACNFSSLLWPAGSAPAALASLLFDPPEPQIIVKTQCFATFLPFRASVSSVLLLFLFWSSLF